VGGCIPSDQKLVGIRRRHRRKRCSPVTGS
jgi:hypothetical protein